MKISILTICPDDFDSFLRSHLIQRACDLGLLDVEIVDIRDFAPGCFRQVDDSPYGGGAGMILRCKPVLDALDSMKQEDSHSIILSPWGKKFAQEDAKRLSECGHLILICGHYEGFDARIYEHADEMISIGDYVLTGGELPAMVISEAVVRLLGDSIREESLKEESFQDGLLEYPQYTKPYDYKGERVPDVLLSGDHEKIAQWRKEKALEMTKKHRPDLLIDEDLKRYVEGHVLSEYEGYEASHDASHIRTVIANSFELIGDLDVDVNMVYCIAAYHDIGIRFGREDHHLTSAKWMHEDPELRRWFTEEQLLTMKEAIEDHRASGKEPPRSIYGCIIAEADRDIEPMRIIDRCVIYEDEHHPGASEEEALERVLRHMDEKYSRHGYLKLWMNSGKNAQGLETLRKWIDSGEMRQIALEHIKEYRKKKGISDTMK